MFESHHDITVLSKMTKPQNYGLYDNKITDHMIDFILVNWKRTRTVHFLILYFDVRFPEIQQKFKIKENRLNKVG